MLKQFRLSDSDSQFVIVLLQTFIFKTNNVLLRLNVKQLLL